MKSSRKCEVVGSRGENYWSVTELTGRIRELLENGIPSLRVGGEVSNYFLSRAGHHYFTLKDQGSQIRIVLFRGREGSVSGTIEDGVFAVVSGALAVYERRGEYQVVASLVQVGGVGDLLLRFQELREKLKMEGLFDGERKKKLPLHASRVGVVTSLDGAAVRDIVRVIRDRFQNTEIIISPALVQGEGAAEEISRALHLLDRWGNVDLIIVGRGGGSIEDLWAFNEEQVVRSVASLITPVISAVGHETDTTLTDFAADLRAATPSHAAEIAVLSRREEEKKIAHLRARLAREASGTLELLRGKLNSLKGELKDPIAMVRGKRLRLAEFEERLAIVSPGRQIDSFRLGVRENILSAERNFRKKINSIRANLEKWKGKVESLDPKGILERGYSITLDDTSGTVVRSPDQVDPGGMIRTLLCSGTLMSRVEKK